MANLFRQRAILPPFLMSTSKYRGFQRQILSFMCSKIEDTHKNDERIAVKGNLDRSWSWIPPRHVQTNKENEVTIPVIPRVLLTPEEICYSVQKQGGEDVQTIELNGKLDNIQHFIFVSGRSSRHLLMMARSLVRTLKDRKLKEAPGISGEEGEVNDDWLLVDCFNSVVHYMLPEKRKMLNLEDHWLAKTRPSFNLSLNEKLNDAAMDDLLVQYPLPDNFAISGEKYENNRKLDILSNSVTKKKNLNAVRVFGE
mmetsp:Transcript_5444/g.5599  ORF Transcript_5444/g.5599 Transcript_5444/m.5599 type:complete len:254 (-) Transcript_5444:2-763(-)